LPYALAHLHSLSLRSASCLASSFYFSNDPRPTAIFTLSLHDALPISGAPRQDDRHRPSVAARRPWACTLAVMRVPCVAHARWCRSEEHTSEFQSLTNLVCRLLLEKKKNRMPPGAVIIRILHATSRPSP